MRCENQNMNLNISEQSISILNNPSGYRILSVLTMIYMSLMLCNAILTNRYVGEDSLFVLGGTLTSPFVFILDDIIAEIYGYKIAQSIVITGFSCQFLFATICQLVLMTPSPSIFIEQHAYDYILGSPLLKITLCGCIAYITANLINSYIITQWKIILKGRKFWLRSVASSTISEALYSFIAILMMEIDSINLQAVLKVVIVSFLIKFLYSILFAWPANILVTQIKQRTGIDVYDFPNKFTPFQYVTYK